MTPDALITLPFLFKAHPCKTKVSGNQKSDFFSRVKRKTIYFRKSWKSPVMFLCTIFRAKLRSHIETLCCFGHLKTGCLYWMSDRFLLIIKEIHTGSVCLFCNSWRLCVYVCWMALDLLLPPDIVVLTVWLDVCSCYRLIRHISTSLVYWTDQTGLNVLVFDMNLPFVCNSYFVEFLRKPPS